jgi:hypothetical protein
MLATIIDKKSLWEGKSGTVVEMDKIYVRVRFPGPQRPWTFGLAQVVLTEENKVNNEFDEQDVACDCDFEIAEDPPSWVRVGKCSMHDACESCLEVGGARKTAGGWLCRRCEVIDQGVRLLAMEQGLKLEELTKPRWQELWEESERLLLSEVGQ